MICIREEKRAILLILNFQNKGYEKNDRNLLGFEMQRYIKLLVYGILLERVVI